ncbi:hypothetical protein [Mesorhizobium sp.]|uniref:hypothetical protein n=1 Tax=Mesorhizobium sp. TaxID=1871066 RepID=UPI000FE858C2|nr:hypothetical protein [Mesorhizobium sp.]RWO76140.1 MAG: hypothetical protein EOQ95_32370 [Mesorhizobium sp.]
MDDVKVSASKLHNSRLADRRGSSRDSVRSMVCAGGCPVRERHLLSQSSSTPPVICQHHLVQLTDHYLSPQIFDLVV